LSRHIARIGEIRNYSKIEGKKQVEVLGLAIKDNIKCDIK